MTATVSQKISNCWREHRGVIWKPRLLLLSTLSERRSSEFRLVNYPSPWRQNFGKKIFGGRQPCTVTYYAQQHKITKNGMWWRFWIKKPRKILSGSSTMSDYYLVVLFPPYTALFMYIDHMPVVIMHKLQPKGGIWADNLPWWWR